MPEGVVQKPYILLKIVTSVFFLYWLTCQYVTSPKFPGFLLAKSLEGQIWKFIKFIPWGLQAVIETAIKSCSLK